MDAHFVFIELLRYGSSYFELTSDPLASWNASESHVEALTHRGVMPGHLPVSEDGEMDDYLCSLIGAAVLFFFVV